MPVGAIEYHNPIAACPPHHPSRVPFAGTFHEDLGLLSHQFLKAGLRDPVDDFQQL
jgi:hypothetical protein